MARPHGGGGLLGVWLVVAVAIVVEAELGVVVLGAVPEGTAVFLGAGAADGISKGGIEILRDDGAGVGADELGEIPLVVEDGDISSG